MATRMEQLAGVASSVPGLNERARGQSKAAQDIMLQKAISGGAPAQQIATAAATSAGQAAFAQRQKEQGVAAQVGQAGLGAKQASGQAKVEEQAMKQREQLAREAEGQAIQLSREALQSRKIMTQSEIDTARELQLHGVFMDNNLQIASITQRRDLSALGRNLDNKLLYSRLKFSKDERGRKFTNERQLADYVISNSKTNMEFNGQMKKMKQQGDRKIQVMRAAQAKLEQTLKQGYMTNKGDLDRETRTEIARAAAEMKKQISKEQSKAKARAAQFQAGGTVVGGAIGSIWGPGGAAAGASIGGAFGSVLGGL